MAGERDAVERNGGTYVDTEPWLCSVSTCAVMVDNLVVDRDDNHLTQASAEFLAPVVGPSMQQALAGPPTVTNPNKSLP